MIRSIIWYLGALLLLLFSIPFLLVFLIIGKFNPHAKDVLSLRYAQGPIKIALFLAGIRLTVIGEEHVPKDRAVLYIGNHRSIFDILITISRVPGPTAYLAKIELSKIPLIGTWMRCLHCLFLDRKDLRQGAKTIFEAIELVKSGTASAFVYPEGTRNKGEDGTKLLDFHEGSFKIAQRTGCPIIPVAMSGTIDIFEGHLPWIRSTRVILEYGEPIDPASFSKEEQKKLGSITRQRMEAMLTDQAKMLV